MELNTGRYGYKAVCCCAGTTQGSQTPLQRLVKRMTRFWVRTDIENTERELRDLFETMTYGIKMTTPGILTLHTTDRSQFSHIC